MKISRRNFLELAPLAGLAIASASGPAAGWDDSHQPSSASRKLMSFATFSKVLNSEFVFRDRGGARAIAKLDAVEDLMSSTSERARYGGENFMLRFSGLSEWSPKQTIYRVEHATLGEFDLFVTESAADSNAKKTYIAVINNVDL